MMKKKLIFSDFFATGNNEKKNIYNTKRKKIWCKNLEICYCPICIVRKETVLQYSLLVFDCIARCKAKLYCKKKPLHCIVAVLRVCILQYIVLYCRKISVLQ